MRNIRITQRCQARKNQEKGNKDGIMTVEIMRRHIIYVYFCLSTLVYAQNNNPHFVTVNTEYNVTNSIDYGYNYLDGWGELTPIIMTYVNNNGSVSICNVDSETKQTFIYEYSKDLQYIKKMTFQNELDKLGAFVKDDEGNYYIFYAKQTTNRKEKNMAMVKYNTEGEKIKEYKLEAYAANSRDGIRKPFYAGACRLELSGSMLAVYFAREMFSGHQASYGFVLDKDTFERVDRGQLVEMRINGILVIEDKVMPYTSHSFNQFILPVEGGFLYANQGDVYPRGFVFEMFKAGRGSKELRSFTFKQGRTYQYTFAQLGGLAKTSNGYIFLGAYEKSTSVSNTSHNDSRNLFVLTFDDNLTSISKPIWITNYANKLTENAANPKIALLGAERYLIMWECMTQNEYKTTYMRIINEKGEPLGNEVELPDIRLNFNDVLRYNQTTGNVHWAVNKGNREIIVYALNPDNTVLKE
jgi:hypothetical protein